MQSLANGTRELFFVLSLKVPTRKVRRGNPPLLSVELPKIPRSTIIAVDFGNRYFIPARPSLVHVHSLHIDMGHGTVGRIGWYFSSKFFTSGYRATVMDAPLNLWTTSFSAGQMETVRKSGDTSVRKAQVLVLPFLAWYNARNLRSGTKHAQLKRILGLQNF